MKKKLLALLCAITCALSLCACDSKAELSEKDAYLCEVASAMTDANLYLCQMIATSTDDVADILNLYNKEEMKAQYDELIVNFCDCYYGSDASLGAFDGMLSTYAQAAKDMGGIVNAGTSSSEIKGKTIICTVELTGNDCNGTFVCKYSKDIYTRFLSGEAVASTSLSQKLHEAGTHMGDAGLNTLLGMGTVFIVLILISFLISGFKLLGGKKKVKKETVVETTTVETTVEEENLTDDTELVAVIMAAISAYEGNSSTDGFVVRTIRKANRRN